MTFSGSDRPIGRRYRRPMADENGHPHDHGFATAAVMDEAFWDERYGSRSALWSRQPNLQLVSEVQSLRPGLAPRCRLRRGRRCHLAGRTGWRVTGVDLSNVALARAGAHAAQAGPELADRLTWLHMDLDAFVPEPRHYSLVSAQFVHLASGRRESLHRRLADAVAPGGTLLIVSHDPSDLETTMGRPPAPDVFASPTEIAATFPRDAWEVVVAESRPRLETDPNGDQITVHDAVVRMQRLRS